MTTISQTSLTSEQTDGVHSPLARLAGPLALAAGSLFTLTQLVMLTRITSIDRNDPRWRELLLADPTYLASGVVYFAVFCVMVVALVAIYGREAHKAGAAWSIGVCAAVIGTMNLAGNFWFEGFVSPWLADVGPEVLRAQPSGLLVVGALLSYGLFTLGWTVFGLASLRARLFPVPICLALVVGSVLGFNASPPFGVPTGLAIATLGVWMLRATYSNNVRNQRSSIVGDPHEHG